MLKHDLSAALEPGSDETGWLARTGHVPLGYFKDAEKTAKTFPVVDGPRYAVPGDHARVAADGTIVVLGRGSVSINSGGEKIYPEEVEKALKHHPAVYDAVVVGTPNERFGEQVTAVVQTARRRERRPPDELVEFAAPAPRPLQAAARRSSSSTRWCAARRARPTTAGRSGSRWSSSGSKTVKMVRR